MQVVYSGGSTPSPSPRLPRKAGYGRPIMPGYMTHVHPQILVQRSREKFTEGDTTLRDSIPAMSKCVATLCLLLNIILPGFGTLTAGLSVLCCSHVRPKGDSKGHCIWVNAGVALVQFMLTFLFLLGWIWSIMWGVAFLSVSKQYYYKRHEEDQRHKHGEKSHTKMQHLSKPSHSASDGNSSSSSNSNNTKKYHSHHSGQTDRPQENHHHQQHLQEQRQLHAHLEVLPEADAEHSDVATTSSYSGAQSDSHHNKNNTFTTNSNGYTSLPINREPGIEAGSRQPIIVLQQASRNNQLDSSDMVPVTGPCETIMKARTRHMKMLQRKMSDNDLSPFVLTHQQLEAIVVHDMPINAPAPRANPESSSIDEGLPKT